MYRIQLGVVSVRGLAMSLANVSIATLVLDAQRLDTRTIRYLVSRLLVLYLAHCLILNVPFMLLFITVLVICHLLRESYNILSTD